MDNIVIESFIAHCDEMMIAEESARGIKNLFKTEIERVKELKKKASEAKGKTKKMLPLYKEAKQILLELEKKVNGMEAHLTKRFLELPLLFLLHLGLVQQLAHIVFFN